MPEMHFRAPKMTLPDVDMDLKGPKMKGSLDVSAPKIEGEMKAPEVDIKGPLHYKIAMKRIVKFFPLLA